uniref:uncharacterized protein LOC120341353 n=2 Tax=Styela clava TaxID=7725 RepID=UPI001939D851|nr:uncharacterized protein LOC120341353 [Styela clava]
MNSSSSKKIHRCNKCHMCFEDCGDFILHHHRTCTTQLVPESLIKEWWRSAGGKDEHLSHDAIQYFKLLHKENSMLRFSCDAVTVIPNLFPSINRHTALEQTRIVFDHFERFLDEKDKIQPAETIVTDEELAIVEYIGGYILQKLRKKSKTEMQYNIINELISDDSSVAGSSLINILENKDYGTLVKPVSKITDMLAEVELNFRKYYSSENVMASILNSIKVVTLFKPFGQVNDKFIEILWKICEFFVKIRCFQKAKTLNKKFQLKHDQNVSLRKSLK